MEFDDLILTMYEKIMRIKLSPNLMIERAISTRKIEYKIIDDLIMLTINKHIKQYFNPSFDGILLSSNVCNRTKLIQNKIEQYIEIEHLKDIRKVKELTTFKKAYFNENYSFDMFENDILNFLSTHLK